jgi:uncharacterized RDD family membrane protein YckC
MDLKYSNIWHRLADFYLSSFLHLFFTLIGVLILIQMNFMELNFFAPQFWTNVFIIFGLYHLIETSIEGLTGFGLAKQILGMRLLDITSSKPIGVFRALLRTIFAIISFLIFGLGFIAIAFNREHKSLHDLLSGSKVVTLPKQGLARFLSIFLTVVTVIPGLIVTIALLGTLSTLPLGATKSLINLSKPSGFQLEAFNIDPELKVNLPYQQKRLTALTELNGLEYIEYNVDPLSRYNYIQPEVLKLLGAKITDYDYFLTDWQDDITRAKLKTVILIPKLTFKDKNNVDLTIYNQKFLIHPSKTSLGTDFLDIFDYQINNSAVMLGLFAEDQEVLKDSELDLESKNYLLYVLRSIRAQWRDYQSKFSAPELEEFATVEDKVTTVLELDFDTKAGYIKSAVLTEPSKNEVFNKSCSGFIRGLPKFTNIPTSLQLKESYKLKLSLTYQEILSAQ